MRFIRLDENNRVISIRYGPSIVDGEIQSDTGELGQIMMPDGTFIDPEPEQIPSQETIEEKLERLEQQLQETTLIQYDALATIFEEIIALREELNGGV